MANFANSLGIAFQIQDDILDYYGDESLTGKKLGKDFEEGKFTLPIILALKQNNNKNQTQLLSLFKRGRYEDFPKILSLLDEGNVLKTLQKIFASYAEECMGELKNIPQNSYKDALEDIVSNLGSRLT